MTDPGVHDPDPIVHDGPILVFTMDRSERSRWGDARRQCCSLVFRQAQIENRVIWTGPTLTLEPELTTMRVEGEIVNRYVNHWRVNIESIAQENRAKK